MLQLAQKRRVVYTCNGLGGIANYAVKIGNKDESLGVVGLELIELMVVCSCLRRRARNR